MSELLNDALIAGIMDRLQRIVHEIRMTINAGGLPKSAVKALVEARIGVIGVYSKLNNYLIEAELADDNAPRLDPEVDNPRTSPGSVEAPMPALHIEPGTVPTQG